MSLSVVIATFNEEKNIEACLRSVTGIVDEVIVIDGQSQDKTPIIAKKMGATVISVPNRPDDFHANKQLGIDHAKSTWILQLDADEQLTNELQAEIQTITAGAKASPSTTQYAGYAIPRRNWFLGRFLTKGGAYPDPVVRLFKNGKGQFLTAKIVDTGITTANVHAQIEVDGKVGQLQSDLLHYGDQHIDRYLARFNRYTTLEASNLQELGMRVSGSSFFLYTVLKPTYWFLMRYFRHRGYVDGFEGFLFALLSCLHYPVIYLKIWEKRTH